MRMSSGKETAAINTKSYFLFNSTKFASSAAVTTERISSAFIDAP
jgi:hypothetical protein